MLHTSRLVAQIKRAVFACFAVDSPHAQGPLGSLLEMERVPRGSSRRTNRGEQALQHALVPGGRKEKGLENKAPVPL